MKRLFPTLAHLEASEWMILPFALFSLCFVAAAPFTLLQRMLSG